MQDPSFSPFLLSLLSVPTKPVPRSVYASFAELLRPPNPPGECSHFPVVGGPLWSDLAYAPSPLHVLFVIARLLHYQRANAHVKCVGRLVRKGLYQTDTSVDDRVGESPWTRASNEEVQKTTRPAGRTFV